MKENNYFDYDGNIPSVSGPFSYSDDEAYYLNKSNSLPQASEEALEAVPSYIPEPAEPGVQPEEKPEQTDETPEQPSVDFDELNAAIEAFEHMNLPKEELHKELEEKRGESEEGEKPKEAAEKKAEQKEKKSLSEKLKNGIGSAAESIKKKNGEKEYSRLRHFFIIVLLLILVVVIFVGVITIFMESIDRENKRSDKFAENAAKICSSYCAQYGNANYENLYDSYKVEGYRLTGLCFAREMDFDNDGDSELMLVYNKSGVYYNEVWGMGEMDEFALLYSEAVAQSSSKAKDAYSLIYHSKNKYYIAKFDKEKNSKFSLMQLKRGKFEKKFDGAYDGKTKAYSVDGKDDTNAFEKIKYSVLKEEKASVEVDKTIALLESFRSEENDIDSNNGEQSLESAYYQVVQDYNKRYGVSKYVEKDGNSYIDGLAVVELIDFDGDGKQEMLLVYRKPVKERSETARGENVTYEVYKYYCDIYRYSGSKAVLAYTNEGLSNKLNYRSDIYYLVKREDKKAYYCLNSFKSTDYGKHITAVSSEYKFDGEQFISTFKASYQTDYGYSEYSLDGKTVDKYRFNNNGYKNPFFDGDEDYDKEKFRVTYVQRRSADALELEDIPKQTEKTIQSLNQLYSADIK